jgi:hypothetical protein
MDTMTLEERAKEFLRNRGILPTSQSRAPAMLADFVRSEVREIAAKAEAPPATQASEVEELLRRAGAFMQSLDLETDYYINGERHPQIKQEAVTLLHDICMTVEAEASHSPAKENSYE